MTLSGDRAQDRPSDFKLGNHLDPADVAAGTQPGPRANGENAI